MSSKVQFTLYLGDGTIENGPNGVLLTNFQRTFKYIDRPGQRSIESIYYWLVIGLRINVETHLLSVQTFVNWADEGVNLWELMTISNTKDWKMYIDSALHHGWPPAMVVRAFPIGQDVGGAPEEVEVEKEVPEDVHEQQPEPIQQEIDVNASTRGGR